MCGSMFSRPKGDATKARKTRGRFSTCFGRGPENCERLPQPRHELLRYAQLARGGEGFAEYDRQLAMLGFQLITVLMALRGCLHHLRSPSDDRGGGRVAAGLQVLGVGELDQQLPQTCYCWA